jgi:hypothetical protein
MDCARCIEDAIAAGMTQDEIARDYAMAMYSEVHGGWEADWSRVNKAIAARWPKGLARVKKAAHRKYRELYKEQYAP